MSKHSLTLNLTAIQTSNYENMGVSEHLEKRFLDTALKEEIRQCRMLLG